LRHAKLLLVKGVWQREGEVCNLIAGHLQDLTPSLSQLSTHSRDFR
jgi:error-prone DNA polymerase